MSFKIILINDYKMRIGHWFKAAVQVVSGIEEKNLNLPISLILHPMTFLENCREKYVVLGTLDTELQWECETRQVHILSESRKVELRNGGAL